MKHAREDYSRIQDPAGLIPDDEPVFLLRGQDPLAAALVEEWALRYMQIPGASVAMGILAMRQSRAMEKWAVKKTPDLPVYSDSEDVE